MKKFVFTLERVMDWRRTQARVEESKLERLYAELRGIDARQAAVLEERAESEEALRTANVSTGLELAALDAFQRFTVAERARLESARLECRKRSAAQIQIVAAKRRDVRLLERLREQRLKTWETELGREIDAQADEAFLAKWKTWHFGL